MDFESISEGFINLAQQIKRKQFGGKAQLIFLEDFYLLINDGIPPNRAIEMMARASTGLSKEVASSVAQKIAEGQALAIGMHEWFSPNIIEIIRIGEEGGVLAETMKSAISSLKQQSGIWGAFAAAIFYPGFVFAVACGIILLLNAKVFTEFARIKPADQWPAAGQLFLQVADLIQHWWWLVIVAVIVTIMTLRVILVNYVGELRSVLDNIIPFSLYRRLVAARLLETLGLLVANGVVFKAAIKTVQHQANPYLLSHLMMMEHFLSMGKGNIADVLSTGLLDEQDILRLRVMAEVKGFEHGLVRMGVNGAIKTAKTLELIGKILGGLLLSLDCGMILLIVMGLMQTGQSLGS
jgi:type II secretory pathway component PulF